MVIEPLATIIAWVIGISAIIFIPVALVSFIIFTIRLLRE